MSNSESANSTGKESLRYATLASLRSKHEEFIKCEEEGSQLSTFLDAIATFIQEGRITGKLLDSDHERRAAQSWLDFWATRLERAGRAPLDATLADFDPALAPELPNELCPYRGLDAFRSQDRHLFYGRQRLIEFLLNRLKDGQRLVAVMGPSGSGKSSLVLAGLYPFLQDGELAGSEHWRYLRMTPGSDPLASLAQLLQPPGFNTTEWLPQQVTHFQQNAGQLVQLAEEQGDQPLVLIVDQFEELFTLCPDESIQQAFVDNLMRLVQAPTIKHMVVLTMRSDFESHITRLPSFQPCFEQARVQVTPLNLNELRDAIEKPAEQIGLKFEEGVVEALLRDILGEPAALPLLQFTLLKLWEHRQRNQVTWAAYQQLGGGRLALEHSADEFYNQLIPEEQTSVKRILLRMVRPGAGLEVTSNRIRRETLYYAGEASDRVNRVLEKLIQVRLVRLTKGESPADDQVEVAHEALVRNWQRLVGWLDEERVNIRRRLRLREAAEEWVRLGKDASMLWSGVQLDEALRFEDYDDLEKEFIQASIAYRDRAAAAKEAQRQREMETLRELARTADARRQAEEERTKEAEARTREQAAATKRQRQLTMSARVYAFVATVLFICAIFLLFTWIRNYSALQKANSDVANKNLQLNQKATELQLAGAGRLAESALGQLNSKPANALKLALKAITQTVQITNVVLPSVDSALRQGLNTVAGIPLATYTETAKIAASSDGRWLATYGKGVGLQLWNMMGDAPSLTFSLTPDPASIFAYSVFSPDSRWLAVIGNNDLVRIWDVSGKGVKADRFLKVKGHANGFANMAFDPTSQWLVTIDARGDEQLYVLTQTSGDLTPIKQLSNSADGLMLVAFGPPAARERALFVVNGTQIDHWDIHDPAELKHLDSLPIPEGSIGDWRLDPAQGRWLATIDFDGAIWLHDLMEPSVGPSLIFTPTVLLTERENMPLQPQLAFDPKGQLLVTARGDQTLQLWKLGDQMPHKPWRELKHAGTIRSFAFSPDGKWLTVVDSANEVCRWGVMDVTARSFCLQDNSLAQNTQATFSVDGRWLTTWGQDNVPRLLDLSRLADRSQPSAPQRFVPVYGHNDAITDLAITGNGKWLMTSSADGHVRLLDLTSNWQTQNPTRLPLNEPVQTLIFAATDNLSAANAASGHIFTWQPAAPLDVVTNTFPVPILQGVQRSGLVALHRSGELVAVGNSKQDITLWKLSDNHPLSTVLVTGQSSVQKLAFSRNGVKLAAATQNGVLYVWNISDLQASVPVTISSRYTPITALALSDDGRWLAVGAENVPLQIWSLDQPAPQPPTLMQMRAEQIVRTIAFSSDNQWLAVGGDISRIKGGTTETGNNQSSSGFIRLWRLGANTQRITPSQPIELIGHTQPVSALAFSPQGDLLASGSLDSSVRLWELQTITNGQKARLVLTDHAAPVQNLAFSQDGHWLASSDRLTLFLWNMRADEMALDVKQLVAAACRKVGCTPGESSPMAPFAAEPTYCGTCDR